MSFWARDTSNLREKCIKDCNEWLSPYKIWVNKRKKKTSTTIKKRKHNYFLKAQNKRLLVSVFSRVCVLLHTWCILHWFSNSFAWEKNYLSEMKACRFTSLLWPTIAFSSEIGRISWIYFELLILRLPDYYVHEEVLAQIF